MSGIAHRPTQHGYVLGGLIAVITLIAGAAIAYAVDARNWPTAPGSGDGAPTITQAQQLLNRHARAVLDHDRASFARDLDSSPSASAYRANQLSSFDNLAAVPLSAWAYTVAAPVNGPAENKMAARRYGSAVLMTRIDFRYALRDVDPAPATYQLYVTFVRRDGQIRISSDADLVSLAGASWHGPWDFGPLRVKHGSSSLVLAHPAHADDLDQLAAVVDRAVPAVTAVWGTDWNRQVAVIVPDTQSEMNEVIANTLPLRQIAATTYVNSVSGGRALGVRVAVNPANLSRLDAVGLAITITHEVTLVATWATKTDSTPTWLAEGFAEYVANRGTGQTVPFAASELAAEVRADRVPATLPTTASFTSDSARLPQIYEEAWLACALIAERGGAAALPALLRQVSSSGLEQAAAVNAALQSRLHLDTAEFTLLWQQYLRAELA